MGRNGGRLWPPRHQVTGLVLLAVLAAVSGAFAAGWKAGAGRTGRKIAEATVRNRDEQIKAEQNRPLDAAALAARLRDGQ